MQAERLVSTYLAKEDCVYNAIKESSPPRFLTPLAHCHTTPQQAVARRTEWCETPVPPCTLACPLAGMCSIGSQTQIRSCSMVAPATHVHPASLGTRQREKRLRGCDSSIQSSGCCAISPQGGTRRARARLCKFPFSVCSLLVDLLYSSRFLLTGDAKALHTTLHFHTSGREWTAIPCSNSHPLF